jgi:MFS family permease
VSTALPASTVWPGRPLRRRPDFLKLWGGQSVSLLGSQVTVLALPLTAIYTLHASALQVGLLGTAQWLPFMLIALPVGAWSDRHRRRPALITADAGRAVLLGAVVGLGAAGILTMPVLIAAAFCLGLLTVVFEVCYTSYLPALVPRAQLLPANSMLQASASAAQVGGPGVGGVLVQLLTAPIALAVDAASFAVSAASLAWITAREPTPARGEDQDGALARVRAGLAFTLGDQLLRALVGTSAIYNLFDQWIFTLFTLFAARQLGLPAAVIGLIFSVGGAGAVAGSLLAGPATARLGTGRAIVWSVAAECAVMLAIPCAPASRAAAIPLLAAAYLFNCAGTALSTVVALSVRQAITPDRLLGRVNGSYRFASYSVISLGALLGGAAGHVLGLRAGLAAGAVGLLGTVAWVLASPLPRMRRVPQQAITEPAPAGPLACRRPADGLADSCLSSAIGLAQPTPEGRGRRGDHQEDSQ